MQTNPGRDMIYENEKLNLGQSIEWKKGNKFYLYIIHMLPYRSLVIMHCSRTQFKLKNIMKSNLENQIEFN